MWSYNLYQKITSSTCFILTFPLIFIVSTLHSEMDLKAAAPNLWITQFPTKLIEENRSKHAMHSQSHVLFFWNISKCKV